MVKLNWTKIFLNWEEITKKIEKISIYKPEIWYTWKAIEYKTKWVYLVSNNDRLDIIKEIQEPTFRVWDYAVYEDVVGNCKTFYKIHTINVENWKIYYNPVIVDWEIESSLSAPNLRKATEEELKQYFR